MRQMFRQRLHMADNTIVHIILSQTKIVSFSTACQHMEGTKADVDIT